MLKTPEDFERDPAPYSSVRREPFEGIAFGKKQNGLERMEMRGGIYTKEKCPECGCNFKDNGRNGLQCPKHPRYWATKNFQVRFLRRIHREFKSYEKAFRFLNGLRYEVDVGKFDERDYQEKIQPLAFENLSDTWLKMKRQTGMKKSSWIKIKGHIHRAVDYWRSQNIKNITAFDLQKYLLTLTNLSSKSQHNHLSTLRQFWHWVSSVDNMIEMPQFPRIRVKLGWRKTISKDLQQDILAEIQKIAPYKVWIGVKFLATYFNVRPGELLAILERDIELDMARIWIRKTKEGEAKYLYLLEEDVILLEEIPPVINPNLRFFRHGSGISGVQKGAPYGEKYLYKWWKRAAANLGITDVDLYGGTRHSTVQYLRDQGFSPEELRMASGHTTSKAFTRYFGRSPNYLRRIYAGKASNSRVIDLSDVGSRRRSTHGARHPKIKKKGGFCHGRGSPVPGRGKT